MARTISKVCNEIACNVDRLLEQRDYEGLKAYLPELETYVKNNDSEEYAPIFYYLGTIYTDLADQEPGDAGEEYRKIANYNFRMAIERVNAEQGILLQIYINYANNLDRCGRVLEALEQYRKAMELEPRFGMAVGNYGIALQFLADLVNDPGHYRDLHCYAYQAIQKALEMKDNNIHQDARSAFSRMLERYDQTPKEYMQGKIEYPEYTWNNSKERRYRQWCLDRHLFLNPLNEVADSPSAFAHDPLVITSYIEEAGECELGETPHCFAMLNQLKEEYIYARYLCYEGLEERAAVHFADKDVKLTNGLDYCNYSIRLEQLKSAFRILFSMFDQIAFWINDFWKMGYPERQASADKIFKSERYPKDNLMLSAMRWTYMEFYERFGDAERASEKDLKDLRNALEHKFVKIHEYKWERKLQLESDRFYHVDEQTFGTYALRLLRLTREMLMYLVYAIKINEDEKEFKAKVRVPLTMMDFDDDWKR